MKIEARFTGFDEALGALTRGLDRGLEVGFERAAEVVAANARGDHPFTNRTGDLERSIHAEPDPHVALARGAVDAAVVADEDYASYVDEREGFAFLEPAAERRANDAARAVDAALDDAAAAAGWKR